MKQGIAFVVILGIFRAGYHVKQEGGLQFLNGPIGTILLVGFYALVILAIIGWWRARKGGDHAE